MGKTTLKRRKRRFFYGWVIVAVSLDGLLVHGVAAPVTFGVFLKPMAEDLEVSRSAIFGAASLGSIMAGISGPFVGRLVDRHGPRMVMALSAVIAGGFLAALAGVGSLWQLYFYFGVGVGLVRPGISHVTTATAIGNWFIRKRGRAYAVAAAGVPLGGAMLVLLAQFMVSNYSWQAGWLTMAAVVWGLLVIPALVLLRRRPEDMGLLPDGDPPAETSEPLDSVGPQALPQERDWTAREAFRARVFWLVMFTLVLSSFASASTNAHLVPYFTDRGRSDAVAAFAVTVWGIASLVAKVFWGVLVERYGVQLAYKVMTLVTAISIALMVLAASDWAAFVVAGILGWSSGGMTQLSSQVWPDYFGRAAQGVIRGWGFMFISCSVAFGPLFAALMYDALGSYYVAFGILVALAVIAHVLITLAPPPRPEPGPRAGAAVRPSGDAGASAST